MSSSAVSRARARDKPQDTPLLTPSQPLSTNRLRQICNDACDTALSGAAAYSHADTPAWNEAIIQKILRALISESTPADEASSSSPSASTSSRYKFAVNSTIIQHLTEPRGGGTSGSGRAAAAGTQTGNAGGAALEHAQGGLGEESVSMGAADEGKKTGRRGMHSASGAYWNNERDGMWSHKYEGGEGRGMDIVISVIWIAV